MDDETTRAPPSGTDAATDRATARFGGRLPTGEGGDDGLLGRVVGRPPPIQPPSATRPRRWHPPRQPVPAPGRRPRGGTAGRDRPPRPARTLRSGSSQVPSRSTRSRARRATPSTGPAPSTPVDLRAGARGRPRGGVPRPARRRRRGGSPPRGPDDTRCGDRPAPASPAPAQEQDGIGVLDAGPGHDHAPPAPQPIGHGMALGRAQHAAGGQPLVPGRAARPSVGERQGRAHERLTEREVQVDRAVRCGRRLQHRSGAEAAPRAHGHRRRADPGRRTTAPTGRTGGSGRWSGARRHRAAPGDGRR